MFRDDDNYIGKLVGNTGEPNKLTIALRTSFSARRGEFVRVAHQERESESQLDVLGRIVGLSRSNILFSPALGEGISEVELLPQSRLSGETVYATLELVGYKDPFTGEIRIPRRPLTPGTKVYGVDYAFLTSFYEFSEDTSIHLGNLVGYEKGENIVPVFLDANTLVTEHLAVLAMTGSGKSYTVGRVIERLVSQLNASVVVFDPHGEYGKAFRAGKLNFNDRLDKVEDPRDRQKLAEIQDALQQLQDRGGGIKVYTPQLRSFDEKYAGKNKRLALQLDHFDVDEFSGVLPGLTEPQQRVLDVALRYWKENIDEPRDIQELFAVLDDLDRLKEWVTESGSQGEANALRGGSANIAAIRLRRMINEAQSFYSRAAGEPFDVYEMVGDDNAEAGRLCIIDLQGLSNTARQVIVALISSELMKAAADKQRPTRPVFIVYEEGHNFAPAGEAAISKNIIKRIAAEGRKFGVGFAIVSQRPSKLDSDVTSQCNTIVAMRIKNPDDQRFIQKTSDYFSAADLAELPTLSTGEALICGRAIIAPLVVKVGTKALIHGGESPRVCERWGEVRRMMGGRSTSPADQVFDGLTNRELMVEHFPMLLSSGIPDIGLTVHSHFLTFLASAGQSQGYSAVAECPIWWARDNGLGDVRADSVWFEKQSGEASLAFEFERFERGDEGKLRGKVENLAIASTATPSLKLCVLIYWVRSGSAPRSMDAIIATYRDGFRRRGSDVAPARTPLMIIKCVMRPAPDSEQLVFGEFLRDERNERLALGEGVAMALIVFRGKPGEELGDRFRLLAELGKGSFGEVWQARRLKDGATVAIKIPKDQEKGEEVLRKESDIIKDIHHPNIVRVHGFHNISELFVIEMEFVDGYDLAKLLNNVSARAPLTFEQMLEWTLQILDGLAAVHAAHISHNDIKPENILVDKTSGTAKITDFGVSRRLEDVWVWTKRNGTEAYMAPEVALEGKRARDVSDIYSIGVLLYEMVTGRLPYSSPHQLLTGVQISKPREVNRDVPTDLEDVILRAMARRPESRFPNCGSMRAAVQACLDRMRAEAATAAMPTRTAPSQLGFRPPSSSPLYYLELAKQRLAEGDAQGAMEAAEAAVDRSDGHPQYLRMLGGICMRLGYHRKAAEAYEQLLAAFDRGYPVEGHQRREVLERLGQLYINLQRYGDAVAVYERLVDAVDRPYSRFRLAVAAGLDGDYGRAIQLLETVRAERPDAVVVYSKLGWAHALNGNDRLALSFYNQALALDAFDLFSLFELGKYYFMVGDRRRSREYFERVMDADKQGFYSDRVRELTNPTA